MFSRFSRRHFLSLVGLTITGTAIATSVPFLNQFLLNKAQAQEISEEVYKGRKYKIVIDKSLAINTDNIFDSKEQLFIDGKKIKVLRHKKTNKYVTPLLFGEFESPKKIATVLIDLGLRIPDNKVEIDPDIE